MTTTEAVEIAVKVKQESATDETLVLVESANPFVGLVCALADLVLAFQRRDALSDTEQVLFSNAMSRFREGRERLA